MSADAPPDADAAPVEKSKKQRHRKDKRALAACARRRWRWAVAALAAAAAAAIFCPTRHAARAPHALTRAAWDNETIDHWAPVTIGPDDVDQPVRPRARAGARGSRSRTRVTSRARASSSKRARLRRSFQRSRRVRRHALTDRPTDRRAQYREKYLVWFRACRRAIVTARARARHMTRCCNRSTAVPFASNRLRQ